MSEYIRKYKGYAFNCPNPSTLIDKDISIDDTIKDLMEYINESPK